MKAYKLTDKNGCTYGGCQWGENVTHETNGEGELCGPGYIHFYKNPYMAVLLNPIHANFSDPLLWIIEAEGNIKKDRGLKWGATKVTTIKTMSLPQITTEQRVKFAIRCAKKVYNSKKWNEWADNWLNGTDRAAHAAHAAYAAHAAAYAARAAAHAAAHAAAYAADAARAAAYAAAYAARAAARAAINFEDILTDMGLIYDLK